MQKKINNQVSRIVTDQTNRLTASLAELEEEATRLFNVLDFASETINNLEKRLQNISANFPFRMEIKKEERSNCKKPEPYHEGLHPAIEGYFTQLYHYLAWDGSEESPKKFRLLLIHEEVEIIYFQDPTGNRDYIYEKFQFKCVYKKPVIETDLETRLYLLEYLDAFILKFKDYLRYKRISIEHADTTSESQQQF